MAGRTVGKRTPALICGQIRAKLQKLGTPIGSYDLQIAAIANGWKKVVDKFNYDHVSEMGKSLKRMIVLVLDFDGYKEPDGLSYENRLVYIKSQVPAYL